MEVARAIRYTFLVLKTFSIHSLLDMRLNCSWYIYSENDLPLNRSMVEQLYIIPKLKTVELKLFFGVHFIRAFENRTIISRTDCIGKTKRKRKHLLLRSTLV